MIEKIVALVFSIALLVITILWNLDAPTVENLSAVACSAIAVIALVVSLIRKDYIVVSDAASKGGRTIDDALKISNEIKNYIRKKNGRIYLRIKKW